MSEVELSKQDKSGPYRHEAFMAADPFAYQASHKRVIWFLRLSVFVNVILVFGFVIVVLLLKALFPLKETQIALIRGDDLENKIFKVEPISEETKGFYLFLEQRAKRYVSLLLPIDSVTQDERFREASTYSDRDFFNGFLRQRRDNIEQAIKDGLNRSIVVESANQVLAQNSIYQYAVDFIQVDEIGGITTSRPLRAYINMTPRPFETKETEKFENPFGVFVVDMVVKERTVL